MAGDMPSDSACWGEALLLFHSPADLSASFLHSVVGASVLGCLGKAQPPPLPILLLH